MRRVFSRPPYLLCAAVVALISFVAIVIARDAAFLAAFVSSRQVSPGEAAGFLTTFLFAAAAGAPALDLVLAIVSAVLIGITAALGLFYARMYRAAPSVASGVGLIGAVSAFLGFGCAACGSVFLASVFAGSLGSLAALLPFGGKEVSFLGIALLAFAAFALAHSISKPRVCPV